MWFALGLREASYCGKAYILPVILRDVVLPEHFHRRYIVLDLAPSMLEVAAQDGTFLRIPSSADAEQHAPTGAVVERGHLLRGQDRIALRDQADAGAQFDAVSCSACSRQREQWIGQLPKEIGHVAVSGAGILDT